jgi:hypothetical protein
MKINITHRGQEWTAMRRSVGVRERERERGERERANEISGHESVEGGTATGSALGTSHNQINREFHLRYGRPGRVLEINREFHLRYGRPVLDLAQADFAAEVAGHYRQTERPYPEVSPSEP